MEFDIHQLDPTNPVHNAILAFMDWRRQQGKLNLYLKDDFLQIEYPDGRNSLSYKNEEIIQWKRSGRFPDFKIHIARLWEEKGE